MKIKYLLMALPLLGAFSTTAMALNKDITVSADIDPTLDLVKAAGDVLPDTLELGYDPTTGIKPKTMMVSILTNDTSKNINVKLASDLVLNNTSGSGTVPMTVTLNAQELTTADKEFTKATLGFNSTTKKSMGLPLVIKQTTQGALADAGTYQGMLHLVLAQKA